MGDILSSPSTQYSLSAVELYYGGQRLYPAPLVSFERNVVRSSDDSALTYEDTWTLRGIYLNNDNMGYENVVTNMEMLKSIFASDGLELQIKAGAGSASLPSGTLITSGVYPVVQSVSIPEANTQFHRFEYEVTILAKTAASGVTSAVEDASDSWQFQESDDRLTVSVTHSVSAKGSNTNPSGSSNALENAKTYVDARLGAANVPSSYPSYVIPGDVDGDTSTIFEYQRTRSENVDVEAGSYEVTETFVYVSGTVPYSDSRTYSFQKNQDGVVTVGVQGSVEGYPRTDGTNNPYAGFYNAQSGFENAIEPLIHSDASSVYSAYGGSGTLYNKTMAYGITENRFLGTLAYDIQYTDDPSENLPSGIVEQSLQVQRTDAIRMRQSHVIPQRRIGNIVQDIGTPTEGVIRITASAKAENTGDEVADTNRAISHIQDLINQNRPNTNDFINIYIAGKEQSSDRKSLTANATITYNFIVDLATVQEANTDVILNPIS